MIPRTFNRAVFRFNVFFCLLAAAWGYAQGKGLSDQFDEGRASTFLSCGLLLLTAFFAGRAMLTRRQHTPWSGWRTPWLVWFFVSAGFVYLALDDALRLHERIDHAIHQIFHFHETGLSDRLDDLIIVVYGLLGLGVLWIYRRELLAVRRMLPSLGWGVFYTVVQSGFDTLGNRDDILNWLTGNPDLARRLQDLTETAEGLTEALAEGYLLVAFYAAFYFVRAQGGGPGRALPAAREPAR